MRAISERFNQLLISQQQLRDQGEGEAERRPASEIRALGSCSVEQAQYDNQYDKCDLMDGMKEDDEAGPTRQLIANFDQVQPDINQINPNTTRKPNKR